MAALMMKSASAQMVRPRSSVSRPTCSLKPAVRAAPMVPAAKASSMMVWQPNNNKFFETFSFLPPLSDEQIAKQVDYMVSNGFVPCLEFARPDIAYVSNENCSRLANGAAALYYDNRYWTMWKLPMFGCRDASQVLKEVVACTKAFPTSYVRLVGFDPSRQVQVMGFLVQRPRNDPSAQDVSKRSV